MKSWNLDIGAKVIKDEGTFFRVWAPKVQSLSVQIVSGKKLETIPLEQEGNGYYSGIIRDVSAGDRYLYCPDEGPGRPDPASRFQPGGVHEASQVVDPQLFPWQDNGWSGIPLEEYVIYELHVGTFSREGSFAGIIPFLDYLKALGITALELLPVAQCPGSRNWGYDGVYPYAPQNSYGGPEGLKQLVDACHSKGLAVILDVVYNHLGPEGNYSSDFGHYLTDKYRTPWGCALNFDGPGSDPVNDFFIGNALYWINEFHIDALRLDAVDWIFDLTASHFLQRLAEKVHRHGEILGRKVHLFAEHDANDARLIRPPEFGGYGIDVQWNDSFHHALRTLLTGEITGYYQDYGHFDQMVKAFAEGFVYTGEYSPYRMRRHGGPSKDRPTSQFVVFSQNHDQVGNRKCGDRSSVVQSHEKLLLAAGVVILSPYIPLLFMGEEYGETAPFHYFVDHSDPALIEAVRKGKEQEHASGLNEGEVPDPVAETTFRESTIDLTLKREGKQVLLLEFYRQLLALRKSLPALQVFNREEIKVFGFSRHKTLAVLRQAENSYVVCIYSFSNEREEVALTLPPGTWEKILDSSDPRWGGPGEVAARTLITSETSSSVSINPFSLIVYKT